MKRLCLPTFVFLGIAGSLCAQESKIDMSKVPPAAAGKIDFRRDIEPLFAKACLSCHGPAKQRGGLRLDDADAAFKGANVGPVIRPGKPLESRLLHVVAGLDADVVMPPKGKTPLTAVEIGKLRAWIEQGAVWPRDKATSTVGASSDHWAFRAVRKPALPQVRGQAWQGNPIDAFVLARLEKEQVQPSPEAERSTLIRRLSFDLLGLPPSPREVDEFLQDGRPDAYDRLVDRLLGSPHYGERWGRHWLDLARYADTDGYEADRERIFAWRYRSWVIDALNRDLPFDQFTIEQLAGDLLPGSTLEQKAATGFHRNTLTNKEGGTDKEQFRVEACVDRVNTTAKVWLGVTLGCAQCHDHKYDPFSQREYYQFFAFFNSDDEVDVSVLLPGEAETFAKNKAVFDRKKSDLQAAVDRYRMSDLQPRLQAWEAKLKPEERKKLSADILAILKVEPGSRSEKQKSRLEDFFGKNDKKFAELKKAVVDHEKKAPTMSYVPTLAVGKGRKTHIMIRGDFLRPGIEVQPGTPAVLPQLTTKTPSRLDLARWLVGPNNPLTARVISNWVWHHYFGRGLVPTLEDFGTQGERPSNPQLLDFLASTFKDGPFGGEPRATATPWSLKALHKLIVTSATYRQSSTTRPELVARDPYNVLLARQNRLRLEAEVIRDNALTASGLLVRTVGGPSVKPPQPAGIAEITYGSTVKWVESKGPDRYRRGMYTFFQRTSPFPMLTTFDAPDGVLACVRREKSNTPLQALTLMNDTMFVECAQALGRRIQAEKASSPAERIAHGFRLCLARAPSSRELSLVSQLHDEVLAACRANPKEAARLAGPTVPSGEVAERAAWVAVARTLLNLDEFVNRE